MKLTQHQLNRLVKEEIKKTLLERSIIKTERADTWKTVNINGKTYGVARDPDPSTWVGQDEYYYVDDASGLELPSSVTKKLPPAKKWAQKFPGAKKRSTLHIIRTERGLEKIKQQMKHGERP
jgi:hypothetical protein